MKNSNLKFLNSIVASLLFIVVFGNAFAFALDISPLYTMGGLTFISGVASFIPKGAGIALAGVYQEVWTGEVLKYLTNAEKDTFFEGIPDYSKYVSAVGDEAQAINLVDMDVLPEVLINNTTYPIPIQTIGEEPVLIQLNKYVTKSTPITDDELYAMSYKKMTTLKDRHGLAINLTKFKHGIHALAPGTNTAKMPILLTTGADDGTGRKRLTWEDVMKLKAQVDTLENPEEGRRLVLCSDHLNDLILSDQKFKDQYYNRADGKLYNQLGFEIFDYTGNPYFTPSTKTKLAFGAVPAGTDRKGSVFFSLARSARATGWTKMYYSEAKTDTQNQRNLMNFRHYYTVLPTKEEARGAIVSDNVA